MRLNVCKSTLQCLMKTFSMRTSFTRGMLIMVPIFLVPLSATKQEGMTSRTFQSVNDTEIGINMDMLKKNLSVGTKMRCTTLCMQLGCECTSLMYDISAKTCFMFTKTLIRNNKITTGNTSLINQVETTTGYNKMTECATPRQIAGATIQGYTGCNATYKCDFGFSPSELPDPHVITCQQNETWTPSGYGCSLKPCPSPPSQTNGQFVISTHNVGGVASFECNKDYKNIGGQGSSLTCVLGGTWSGQVDMVCIPAFRMYTVVLKTASVSYGGTAANVYVEVTGEMGKFTMYLPQDMEFLVGETDTYTGSYDNVGNLKSLVIGHDNTADSPGWKLASLTLTVDGERHHWDVNKWIEEAGSLELTLLVL